MEQQAGNTTNSETCLYDSGVGLKNEDISEPQHDTAEELEFIVPEKLFTRLLRWLAMSLSNIEAGSSNLATEQNRPGGERSFLDKLTHLFLHLHDGDLSALTMSNFLSLMLRPVSHEYTPPDASAKLRILGDLYNSLHQQFGQLEDADQAIECYTMALSHTPDTHHGKRTILDRLVVLLENRTLSTGEPSGLQHALEYATQMLLLIPDGDPSRPGYLSNLGNAYFARFEHLGGLEDLDLAVEYYTQAESLESEGAPFKPMIMTNLGNAHSTRYKRLGQPEDLAAAFYYQSRANELASHDSPHKPMIWNNLANSHEARYECLGGTSELDIAIECRHQAILLTPDGHPLKPAYLGNLGATHYHRYERLGRLPDLDLAIKYHGLAASLTADGDIRKITMVRHLGSAYLDRYEHLGQLTDLDTAINHHNRALELMPAEYPNKLIVLDSLSTSYSVRFSRLHEMQDLDRAIDLKRTVISLTSDNDSSKARYLANFGTVCRERFEKTKQYTDLEEAIGSLIQAASLTPNDHPLKPSCLSNLGSSYRCLYEQSGQLPDLDLAIQYIQQAVLFTPEDHSDRSLRLSSLGSTYRVRYIRSGAPEDLNLAIEYTQLALLGCPEGHSDATQIVIDLGRCLGARYYNSQDAADMLTAIEYLKLAAQLVTNEPKQRSVAAHLWARCCVSHQPPLARSAYEYFIKLIPQVVWLGMAAECRYDEVGNIAKVTLEATADAIKFNDYNRALEWLEQGRSIIWNQLLQLRHPSDELRAINASLAEEMVQVANELQISTTLQTVTSCESDSYLARESSSQRRRRLAERWEYLVQQAQTLPGMSHFLAPKTAEQLMGAAHMRVVVIVVVAEDLPCSALVILPQATDITYIPLDGFSYNKAITAGQQIQYQSGSQTPVQRKITVAPRLNRGYDAVLNMLWTSIAKPVLNFLGYTEVLRAWELPHVTWCTTGPLSFLPLHAAGDYTKPNCSLFDYCISSFTPTIGTLLAPPPDPATFSGIAMVGQESAPDFPSIPGTTEELDKIAGRVERIQTTRLDAEDATRDAVIAAMESHSWIHLACHASQNLANPIASAFHLQDGPLDLGMISRKNLKHADLAFLSACQTATGDRDLSDEAIHLAAGMIMAGYRTVIATMWPIHDEDAPLVAERFYEYMLEDGVPDSRKAARALHYAVGCLREKVGMTTYERWAPYIHLGI